MKLLIAVLMLCVAGPLHAGEVEDACTDLVLDYAYYRDRLDADAFADIFAEDAVLSVLGQDFVGRDAIGARLRNAGSGDLLRHLMSTIRIFPVNEKRATGVSYVTVYSGSAGDLPRPLSQPLAIGEYHDHFTRTSSGWKIQRREFVPVFMNAP